MHDMKLQLEGYRLTTAENLYCMTEHQWLITSFIWQFNDLAPRYPKLHEFLDYWRVNIAATIHSVVICDVNGLARRRRARSVKNFHCIR